jgi:hypothetical protein
MTTYIIVAGENYLHGSFEVKGELMFDHLLTFMIFLDEAGHWSYAANSYKKQLMLDYVVAANGKPAACKQVIWHHQ